MMAWNEPVQLIQTITSDSDSDSDDDYDSDNSRSMGVPSISSDPSLGSGSS